MTLIAAVRLRAAVALLPIFVASPAIAVESLQGRIASVAGDDWHISGLAFTVDLSDRSLSGNVRIDSLELPSAGLALADMTIECGRIALSAAEFACLAADYALDLPGVGRVTFRGEAAYERQTGATRFVLRDVPVAEGHVALRGTVTEHSVDIAYSAEMLELAELARIAGHFAPDGFEMAPSGIGNLSGELRIRSGVMTSASVLADLSGASVSNEAGTLVAEGVHALFDVTLGNTGGRWQFDVDISADAGEAYVEPVYANLGESRLTFSAEGHAAGNFADIELATFAITQGDAIDATGSLHAGTGTDDAGASFSGSIELRDSSVHAIYSGLLQVFLAGTAAGDLETSGTVAGFLRFDDSQLTSLDLTLEDLSTDDNQSRFAIYGLNGDLHWAGPGSDVADAEPSRLRWDSASAWNIPLGRSEIEARLGGDDFHLSNAVRVPTMGGALLINHLVLNNFGKEDASGLLDAELEPIELKQLTGAFGWPAFSGSLAGQLPFLQYEGGIVTLGGTLSATAFGGDIEFANLRLEEPLGLVPRLYGDLRLRQLDLEQLTDTFSFGLIQGRLSGDVTDLQMIAWEPMAMDLHLYTPDRDSSRRRISQRAVENLASVGGGGAAAALSSGFMKFFEEFSYDSIGIRCVLQDGTCRMSGAGPAGENEFGRGYYIVKGSGLPRIDVVGYRHQVSWGALVRQLTAITESGAPVVN